MTLKARTNNIFQTHLLSAVVYPEDKQQCYEIENSKKVLGQTYIRSMVCDVVEGSEDVDKTCRVPVMTCFKIKLKTVR